MFRVLPPASPPPFVVCDCVLHVPSSVHTHTELLALFPGVESPQFTVRLARAQRPERRYIVRVGGRACARGLARSQCAKPEARGGPARARGAGMGAGQSRGGVDRSDFAVFLRSLNIIHRDFGPLAHTQTMFYQTRRPPPQVTCRWAPQLYTQ